MTYDCRAWSCAVRWAAVSCTHGSSSRGRQTWSPRSPWPQCSHTGTPSASTCCPIVTWQSHDRSYPRLNTRAYTCNIYYCQYYMMVDVINKLWNPTVIMLTYVRTFYPPGVQDMWHTFLTLRMDLRKLLLVASGRRSLSFIRSITQSSPISCTHTKPWIYTLFILLYTTYFILTEKDGAYVLLAIGAWNTIVHYSNFNICFWYMWASVKRCTQTSQPHVRDDVCEARVAETQPATWSDPVGLVLELLRTVLEEILEPWRETRERKDNNLTKYIYVYSFSIDILIQVMDLLRSAPKHASEKTPIYIDHAENGAESNRWSIIISMQTIIL